MRIIEGKLRVAASDVANFLASVGNERPRGGA